MDLVLREQIIGRVTRVERHGKPVRIGLGLGRGVIAMPVPAWLADARAEADAVREAHF